MGNRRRSRDFTSEEVLSVLSYSPETGEFVWKVSRNGFGGGVRPGDRAGTATMHGYRAINTFGRPYAEHILAWLVMTGEWPPVGTDIDHINRDRSDNRWSNLRLATRSQNNANSRASRLSTTGVKGVSPVRARGVWDARIKVDGRLILLGHFKEFSDAVEARRAAERRFYGEFAPQEGA